MKRLPHFVANITLLAVIDPLLTPAFADSDLRKDQVPPAVIQRFKQDYPKARSIEYELDTEDGQRIYEIDFKVGRRKIQVHYREDGTVISTDTKKSDDDD